MKHKNILLRNLQKLKRNHRPKACLRETSIYTDLKGFYPPVTLKPKQFLLLFHERQLGREQY